MNKLHTSLEYKIRNRRISKKHYKRKLVSKSKNKSKRNRYHGKTQDQRNTDRLRNEDRKLGYKSIVPPKKFSFIENTEEVIEFVNKLDHCIRNKEPVSVHLQDIQDLDYSAITVLLSMMFNFKSKNIRFRGFHPKNVLLKEKLEKSGFIKNLYKNIKGESDDYEIGEPNQIFTQANKIVNSNIGINITKEVGKTLHGRENLAFKGMQRVLVELMNNTNNHANKKQPGSEYWWLSVNHNKQEKKVTFVFVDYGVGIFESFKNKPKGNKWENITSKLGVLFQNKPLLLRKVLEGELHKTVTGEHFRGKGLPGIKQVQDRGQIDCLTMITNDVFANVKQENYKKLKKNFSGTFVYWEMNKNSKYNKLNYDK